MLRGGGGVPTWVWALGELSTLVEKLVEELMPGQVAEEHQGGLAVRGQPTEAKGPLGLQVCEHKWEVLHCVPEVVKHIKMLRNRIQLSFLARNKETFYEIL